MQETPFTNTGNDLLNDLAINLEPASTGKRFVNYLIDLLVYYAATFLVGMVIGLGGGGMGTGGFYVIAFVTLFLLYFIEEGFLKGKTIGKMVTGTRAVNDDGTMITPQTAALRSIIRFVPFEPFSAFGTQPWHDRWANTIVIDERKSTLPE